MQIEKELRLSRFSHFCEMGGGYVALYNALNLAVLFLETDSASLLKDILASNGSATVEELSSSLGERVNGGEFVALMKKLKILVGKSQDEMEDYHNVQAQLENLPVGILYLLLTDTCNFACRYCFVEGSIGEHFGRMSKDTATRGIDLFCKTLAENDRLQSDGLTPQIIFYGGEPLLNKECLEYSLEYIQQKEKDGDLPPETVLTINTNASLITPGIAELFSKYKVRAAVSVDGTPEIHDSQRIFRNGKGTFDAVKKGLDLLKTASVDTSISFTITRNNVDVLEDAMSWVIDNLGVKSLGFNIQRDSDDVKVEDRDDFAIKAAQALVRCFKIAREKGVYEDRMMRKVKSFVGGKIYLNDCGGCGQQIVIAPDGDIGVCHILSTTKEYYTPFQENLDVVNHPFWAEWRKRSPFSMEQCLDCIALSLCGGGCPQQALLESGSIWDLDEVFCVHAKLTLDFLLRDLLEKVMEDQTK